MSLIAGAHYDEGIAELREAFAIKPHPNVLFNIGKAYQEAGRLPEALSFFKRYLATQPPDADQVEPLIEQLQAQLPPPEPKPVERKPVPEERPSPRTAQVDEQAAKRMRELLDRLETAVAKAEAAAAKPAAPAPATETPEAVAEEALGEGNPAVPYEEVVVTASRRAQSTLEAPNSTTIITADEIRASGAQSVVELLRRVPGAEVMELGASSFDVSFRGFNQRIANKVLVLVDGRTEYQDFLGVTLWPQLTIELDEIERVEVIRGPGSALYGANAMLGVINIITKAAGAGPRGEFTGLAGTGNLVGGSFVGNSEDKGLRYRASVGYGQSDKFSRDFDNGRPDYAPMVADPNLGFRTARGNLLLQYTFNRDIQASASAGVSRLYTELYALGVLRNYYLDGVAAYAMGDLTLGPAKLKFFWNHLDGNAGPQYEPIGTRSLLTNIDSNVFDAELLFQKDFDLAGHHSFNAGASGRMKRLGWGYLDAFHSEIHAAVFAQEEWRIVQPFRVIASYRIDRHPLLDNGNPGFAQSPRASMLFLPAEGHAFRLSAATAFREPTFLESYTDLRVPLPGINGASALTLGNLGLKPESLLAYEFGYRGEAPSIGLDWDIALYWNNVSDLITLSPITPYGAGGSFDPVTQTYLVGHSGFVNDPTQYTARGAEVGVHYSPVDGLDLRLSGAVENIVANNLAPGTACGPCQEAPALKVFGGVSYHSKVNVDLSVDGSYSTSSTWIERQPSTSDPTQIVDAAYPLASYAVINARVAYRALGDALTFALVGSQLGPSHQEHPFGNLINQRFFATVTVRP